MSLKAYGTTLGYAPTSGSGSGTFTTIGNIKTIKPMKIQAKDINTTTLTSPNEFEAFLPGLANGGEMEVVMQYDKIQTGTVYGLFRTVYNWKLTYPDLSGWDFTGFVTELGDDEIVNGEIIYTTFKIKVTGQPTQSATA